MKTPMKTLGLIRIIGAAAATAAAVVTLAFAATVGQAARPPVIAWSPARARHLRLRDGQRRPGGLADVRAHQLWRLRHGHAEGFALGLGDVHDHGGRLHGDCSRPGQVVQRHRPVSPPPQPVRPRPCSPRTAQGQPPARASTSPELDAAPPARATSCWCSPGGQP